MDRWIFDRLSSVDKRMDRHEQSIGQLKDSHSEMKRTIDSFKRLKDYAQVAIILAIIVLNLGRDKAIEIAVEILKAYSK
jgi:hypothetical protein